MKIGIFGGSFNPVHNGHLIAAQYVLDEYKLDRIYFIPSYESTYKPITTNSRHRKKIIQLAINNNSRFLLNTCELNNKEVSYTVNTLKKIYNKCNRYYLIVGNEWLTKFNKWHNYEKIFSFTDVIFINRTEKQTGLPGFLKKYKNKISFSTNPVVNISSTMIRKLIHEQKKIRYLVPEKVYAYINRNRLYQRSE
ncbi:MAG: nicotinate-nucleotide adenylyltransferase [Spirochaetes bacterium]|nr:nicotinate-nucleotide adenylyltransferase [Spirochaetota bacterium]